ncbi:MAG: hypothetical protein JWR00_1385 [Rubritepida sp.]|nr:hypothetical protein [Rubritepida sp.]
MFGRMEPSWLGVSLPDVWSLDDRALPLTLLAAGLFVGLRLGVAGVLAATAAAGLGLALAR